MTTEYFFEHLPTELLVLIFNNLRRQPGSLRTLAQTCRRFYNIIIPILYSSICLRDSTHGEKFTRTVQVSSTLASLVRELQVHYHDDSRDTPHVSLVIAVEELRNLEKLSLRSVPLEGLLEQRSHRLLGVFAPRNRPIEMKPCSGITPHRLRSLYIGAAFKGTTSDWWPLGPNEIVFYMESLEKLVIQGAKITRLHPKAFASRIPLKKNSIQEMTLLNCNVPAITLKHIISYGDRLRKFTFKGVDEDYPRPYGLLQYHFTEDYTQALASSASNTLEYLDIDICESEPHCDFTSLENLKHLLVPANMFTPTELDANALGKGRLPARLETLTMKDFDKSGLRTMELIGMLKNGRPPNLRTIKHEMYHDPDDTDYWESTKNQDWNRDIEQFREYGVELSVGYCFDPVLMPENEDWPCECWTYHRSGKSWVYSAIHHERVGSR